MSRYNGKISIIVPIYNIEDYVSKCIESIINQTYSNLEIILVDDGSSDNSGRICDEFKRQDPRIVTIHKENGGLSSARNAGIEAAKGKYIVLFDDDDILEENFVKVANQLIQDEEIVEKIQITDI